jgi:hypothetical protein
MGIVAGSWQDGDLNKSCSAIMICMYGSLDGLTPAELTDWPRGPSCLVPPCSFGKYGSVCRAKQ